MSLSRESAQLFLNSVRKQLPVIESTAKGIKIIPKIGNTVELRRNTQQGQTRGVTLR